jgi:hypothetical protein
LNKAKKDVLKKKAATEEQWGNIAADIEADFLRAILLTVPRLGWMRPELI